LEENDCDDDLKPAAPVPLRDMLRDTSMKSYKSFFGGSDESIKQGTPKNRRLLNYDNDNYNDNQVNDRKGDNDNNNDDDDDDSNLKPAAPVRLGDMQLNLNDTSMRSLFKGSNESILLVEQQEYGGLASAPVMDTSMRSLASFSFGGSNRCFTINDGDDDGEDHNHDHDHDHNRDHDLRYNHKDGQEGDYDDNDDDNLKAASPVHLKKTSVGNDAGVAAKNNKDDMQDSFRSLSINDSVGDEDGI